MTIASALIFLLLLVPVMILHIFLPYLSRETISFGVTISEDTYYSKPVADMRKRYALTSAVLFGVLIVLFILVSFSDSEPVLSIAVPAYIGVTLVGSSILHLYFHRKMKTFKASHPHATAANKGTLAIDTSFRKQRLVLSNKWYLFTLASSSPVSFSVWRITGKCQISFRCIMTFRGTSRLTAPNPTASCCFPTFCRSL
ncbi:hypothetical protein [Paenibacillus caui]|uniref:hypothetical protein n=1 Tax=Paenibacillus caui TaxID=2873927 RepID=UPI001F438349|nr:hypothetical protein [Paenibacillus caui]